MSGGSEDCATWTVLIDHLGATTPPPRLSSPRDRSCLRRSNLLFNARTAPLSLRPPVNHSPALRMHSCLNCMREVEALFPAPALSTGNTKSQSLCSMLEGDNRSNQPHPALLPKSAMPSCILPSELHTRLPAAARELHRMKDAPRSCGSGRRVPALVLPGIQSLACFGMVFRGSKDQVRACALPIAPPSCLE